MVFSLILLLKRLNDLGMRTKLSIKARREYRWDGKWEEIGKMLIILNRFKLMTFLSL